MRSKTDRRRPDPKQSTNKSGVLPLIRYVESGKNGRTMVETCFTPPLIAKESNRRAKERKTEAWQAKEML